jgi:hypothetical protein
MYASSATLRARACEHWAVHGRSGRALDGRAEAQVGADVGDAHRIGQAEEDGSDTGDDVVHVREVAGL